MSNISVKNIGSIITFLNTLDIDFSDDYVYFYRGHSNYTYDLKPSIYRNNGLIKNEDKIFREIILKCPDDFEDSIVTFQKLVKMQHYSLPTRLLDITLNSLIALFFACQDINNDGEVLVFKIPKNKIKYFDSDTVSVVSNLSKLDISFDISKENLTDIKQFNKSDNIKLLLHEIQQEKHFFEPKIVPKHLESVICVKPKLDNQRIIKQDGAFFLFGIDKEKVNCAPFPKEWIFYPKNQRLIIDKSKKEKILTQLKRFGITNSKIFPEIDNIAKDIKESFEENIFDLEPKSKSKKEKLKYIKNMRHQAENIFYNWLKTKFNNIIYNTKSFPDFIVNDNNKQVGYEVKYINNTKTLVMRLKDIVYKTFYLIEHNEFDKIVIVLIFNNINERIKLKNIIYRQQLDIKKINFIIGYIDDKDDFYIQEEIS